MRISARSIEEVRERADIVEVASEFTALKRQGTNLVGLCPYPDHDEKSPSFSVSSGKNFYHCFGCLEANERVWTSKGLIPIAAVEVGDEVIGMDGRREVVTDKWFKSGATLRVRTGAAKEGIQLTPDHWCVFVKKAEALRAISGLHRRSGDGERIRLSSKPRGRVHEAEISVEHASNIRKGDFWLYPVIPDEDRADSALPGEHVIKPYTSGPRNERTASLPVNDRTAWLYGVYAAEGSLYRGGVKWSFSADESETLAARVVSTLKEEFGKPSTKTIRTEKNVCEVTCSSTDLSALLGHWFGHGCANKRVPIEAMSWTPGVQSGFIEGYTDGDGCRQHGGTTATTVSEELAYGIFALRVQAAKPITLNSYPARLGKDGVSRRKTFVLTMPCKESVKGFFAPVNGTTYYWSAVQEVEGCREEPTTVVDITTTGSHTFLTKMGVTHNCQKGGDAMKLVMDLKSLPFVEAVSHLAERFGVELTFEGRSPEEEQRANQRAARRRDAHKALAAATAYYHKYLLKSPSAEVARRYLADRGFVQSTIEEFRLGYAPPRGAGFMRVARKVGLDRGALEAAGLVSARGGERFVERVTFPISDRRGRIVGFGARSLGEAAFGPKYLNSPETDLFNKRSLLYGFPQVAEAVSKERAALVVEGYTDVLMLYQSGIKNAVATLGTALTEQHLKTLSGYADTIYLLFDPDQAGQKAVEAVDKIPAALALEAAKLQLDLRVLLLSKDPADWLLENSAEDFVGLLAGAVPLLKYVFGRKVEQARDASTAERSRLLSDIKGLIKRVPDPVFKREALRVGAEALRVDLEALREEVDQRATQPIVHRAAQRAALRGIPQETPRDHLTEAGRELLALILARPDLAYSALREGVAVPASFEGRVALRPEDFSDEVQARVYALLAEYAGKNLNVGEILADERARPLLDEISALQAAEKGLHLSEASLRAAWLRLRLLNLERSKQALENREDMDDESWARLHQQLHRETRALKAATAVIEAEPKA